MLVYNGRTFVPDCLASIARAGNGGYDTQVLVLDDSSTELGWAEELAELSTSLGMGYYRSPRNMGIPRNMNLALLKSMKEYDYVVLLNSDLVLPLNFLSRMVTAATSSERIGSVTAWSNNVSVFSLTHNRPLEDLAHQHTVDWLSSVVEQEFGDHLIEIPAAVGFCMLIPTSIVREVGLFDPIFGRGYCEEVDWSLRCKSLGFRNVLAPSTFVYHYGSGSTRDAGVLGQKSSTVPAHEAIIDWRFPHFRADVDKFFQDGALSRTILATHKSIVVAAARQYGYCLEATAFEHAKGGDGFIWFSVDPRGTSRKVRGDYMGFRTEIMLNGTSVLSQMEQLIGVPPQKVRISDRGKTADQLIADAGSNGIPIMDQRSYPELI